MDCTIYVAKPSETKGADPKARLPRNCSPPLFSRMPKELISVSEHKFSLFWMSQSENNFLSQLNLVCLPILQTINCSDP